MKLEVGKFYKTRSGDKALVVYIDTRDIRYPVVTVTDRGYELHCETHTTDGLVICDTIEDRHLDLISEWVDEPVIDPEKRAAAKLLGFKWAAMDKDGMWFIFRTKPYIDEADDIEWSAGEMSFYVPFSGSFTGDWKQSLIEL